ncbi:MAG: TolC family protein [Saprospirales bacterium]|nr:TolC family protein [Saprospirales bacterium]MBK8490672.1 TolC family protein [Saprospirales bacterium]
MISKKSALLFSLLLPFWLQAQEPSSFSLQEAIQYAYENNLNLKNAQIKVADAHEQVIERRAVGIPQLRGSLGYNYFIDIPTQIIPDFFNPGGGEIAVQFGTKHSLAAGLDLSVMAFDASYLVGLKAARMYKDYAAQELTTTQQEIKYQVINAYLPPLLVAENLEILDKNIDNLSKLLQETQALYREGFVEQLDVDRLELSLANLKTQRESLSRQKEVALNALKFALGYPMDQEIEVSEDLTALSPAVAENDLTGNINYSIRPEYALVSKGELLNELNVQLNKSGYIPTLDLFGSYKQSLYANKLSEGQWFPTTIVGAQLNVPIFDGLGKKAKVQRSRLDLEIVRNQKLDLERAINLEVQNARTTYLNAQDRLDSQKRNLELAERIFQTTQIKYREGVGSSIEVTQAEQSLYQTQQLYIQSLYDLVSARMSLDKALGR